MNTLGAAAGALVTPWILLRHFAFSDTLQVGAALNATCALGALLVWWWSGCHRAPTSAQTVRPEGRVSVEASHLSPWVWMLIYALSGFNALSLEMVWFRLLGGLQKSTSFTFPSLLAVYLGGLALGVIIGVPLARRARRPAVTFLVLQSSITPYAAIALVLFFRQVGPEASLTGNFSLFSPERKRPVKRDLNSDLFPREEYMVPPLL